MRIDGLVGGSGMATRRHRCAEAISVELRPELMPPVLDEAKVRRLAKLAARLDGAHPGRWEEDLAEFNRLAGTAFSRDIFQGIYGGDEHETWVRRILCAQCVRPADGVTRAELEEVVRRAMPQNGFADCEAYMTIFDANVPRPGASNLICYPPDYDPATNTWGGGRRMGEYDPTPAQIVEWALAWRGREERAKPGTADRPGE